MIGFSQDKSTDIRQLLSDLQNSVLTAVVLVFIVILFALSGRRGDPDRPGDPGLVPDRHPRPFAGRA